VEEHDALHQWFLTLLHHASLKYRNYPLFQKAPEFKYVVKANFIDDVLCHVSLK